MLFPYDGMMIGSALHNEDSVIQNLYFIRQRDDRHPVGGCTGKTWLVMMNREIAVLLRVFVKSRIRCGFRVNS